MVSVSFRLPTRRSSTDHEQISTSSLGSTTEGFGARLEAFVVEVKERIQETEVWHDIVEHLPPLNFITLHYLYFITTSLVTSLIFWGTSRPEKSIEYTDSLFLVVSAMTEAGLNTVNLSEMTAFQQVLLWFLIMLGSTIFVSIATVVTRKRAFERRFREVVRARARERERGVDVGSEGQEGGFSSAKEGNSDLEAKRERGNDRGFEGRHSRPRDPTDGPDVAGPVSHVNEKSVDRNDDAVSRVDIVPTASINGNETANSDDSHDLSLTPAVGLGLGLGSNAGRFVMDRTASDLGVELSSETTAVSPPPVERITPMMRYAHSPAISNAEHHRIISFVGVGAHPNSTSSAYRSPYPGGLSQRRNPQVPPPAFKFPGPGEMNEETRRSDLDGDQYPRYLTRDVTGRNAQFYGLTREEREHLGGVEYRAVSLLAWVVPIYFCMWQVLGCIGLGAYMNANKPDVAKENGINPWWLGIFNGVSAFNNSGMSLLDANMIPFQTSVYTLITMGLLILAGNTAYPLFLRTILSIFLKALETFYPDPQTYSAQKATLLFILRFPRRVYTNLFPLAPTIWLLFMLLALNGIDWVAFELLNIGNPATASIPPNYRVLDGLFQALAVRSGGFYIISIPTLRIGLQVLYAIMMYISVYPVVITMRHSNVYEERSLGIYADELSDEDEEEKRQQRGKGELPKLGSLGSMYGTLKRTFTTTMEGLGGPFSSPVARPSRTSTGTQFIRQQVRGQLAHDLWWLVLAVLFISCIEVSNFDRDPVTYSVFNIAFEVVSGYGCVGISTGLPNEAYSFSGGWHKASKLILCAVMLRGRHRGLPVALDRAVRLPEEVGRSGEREEEDYVLRRSRSLSVNRAREAMGMGMGKVADLASERGRGVNLV